jgi:protease-4
VSGSKNRAVFGVLFLVLLFFIVLMVFANYALKAFQSETQGLGSQKGQVAVIEVEGVIMESKKIIDLLHRAEKNKEIKAIILRIDSPGGAVGPTQEIYQEIRRIDGSYDPENKDAKDANGKPIYASFGSVAASGGYYLGAATRRIYSNPGTITGSIGVIMQFVDLSRLYEFAKVNPQTIKAGRYKDIGQPTRSLTLEEKGLMDNLLQGVHQQFINDILLLRKDRLKKDIQELAQGQIFSGQGAMEAGLVDELGSLWQAGRAIHEELKLEGDFELQFVREKKRITIWDFMDSIDKVATNIGLKNWVDGAPLLMFKF